MNSAIQFTRIRFWMISMSAVFIIGMFVVTGFRGGFNYGVEFQPGLSLQVKVLPDKAKATTGQVIKALATLNGYQVQGIGNSADQVFDIKVRQPRTGAPTDFSQSMTDTVMKDLEKAFGTGSVVNQSSVFVGPRFSSDLTRQILLMVILTVAVILVYLSFRFRFAYAVGAVVATLHDTLMMIAFIGAFQIEISTAIIAAVLTIIGYSLNDTIVVFDRIRENEKLMRESSFISVIDTSITKSLSRTIVTSFTTFLAVLAIFLFTTGSIQNFALALIIGIVWGTYSSIFIASPVLLGMVNTQTRRRKRREQRKFGRGAVPGTTARQTKEGEPVEQTAAEKSEQAVLDKEAVIRELAQRRASSSGRHTSRSQRKKK
jgi:preprotein translocase subunit SecF